MGLRNRLAAFASRCEVPVFPVAGTGARAAVQDLRLRRELRLVDTPRHAAVLLVAGSLDGVTEVRQVHDQLPRPRVTVRWGDPLDGIPATVSLGARAGEDELVAAVVGGFRGLLRGELPSEDAWLPDEDPAEWRGVGPYGRPMAERGPARDGLELDRLPVVVGPWLPALPSGLRLRVVLQSDVVQEVEIEPSPLAPPVRDDVFAEARRGPVPIRELEITRARHLLRVVAEVFRIQDLSGLSRRALRLARDLRPEDADAIEALGRAASRSGLLRFVLRGVGPLDADRLDGLGPVARASGREDDARLEDPAYRAIGHRPVVVDGGDAAARFRQWIAEAAASLRLAAAAGERTTDGRGVVEGLRGRLAPDEETPEEKLLALLPELLAGMEWGDAVAAVRSLDLEPAGVAVTA